MKKPNNMNWYLKHEFQPAIQWAATPDAIAFASTHSNLASFLSCNPYEEFNRCYIISLHRPLAGFSVPLYIGEARRLGRFLVHIWHLANNPRDFFGIEDADIDDIQITFDTHMYFSQNERQKRELQLRKLHEPVLNPPDLLDRCVPRSDRFAEVHRYYNDPAELKKRIDFITGDGMLLYNFNTYLRKKTPCCNYETLPIPYGLRRRVFTYFSSITSNSGPMKNIAEHLGEGFYVEKYTAVKIISRILADGDPFGENEMMMVALKLQIAQRQALLSSLVAKMQ